MNNEILVSLPGFQTNEGQKGDDCGNPLVINTTLIDLINCYPEKFYDGIKIDSVYDSFPCIWGGGRAIPGRGNITTEEIVRCLTPFLERGIDIRFNFTNCLLEERHLKDANANHILQVGQELLHQYGKTLTIVINSPVLEKYLRKNYSGLNYIYSTTIGKLGVDEINHRTENNMLVLDYDYNNDFDFLNQLTHTNNVEVLANENCVPGCPYRQMHFKIYSAVQLGRINPREDGGIFAACTNSGRVNGHIEEKQITTTDFIEKYIPLGINKLKMVGRATIKEELINDYVKWLVKPDYIEEIKEILFNVT